MNNAQRPAGVMKNAPEQQSAPAQSVAHAMPAQFFAVQYGDAQGVQHAALLLKVGETWYMPPEAEKYAASLRPCAKWLADKLTRMVGTAPTSATQGLPTEDPVQVIL